MKAALFCNGARHEDVYGEGRLEKVRALVELYPEVITSDNFDRHAPQLAGLEVVFSTWGMPTLSAVQLQKLPHLKAVFYAAGSVQGFARPLLERQVQVFSAWSANAVPVAEFSLAQILLSCKRYFLNTRACADPQRRHAGPLPVGKGGYGERVALIGAGMIGRTLIHLLKPFNLEVVVVDPYLSDEVARDLGVEKVTLEEAFRTAYVISNHLPNLPATVGLLNGSLFRLMREGATFINTGRGAQVVESELLEILRQRPDLTALLDVTLPEPPDKESEFYTLGNVFLSSHIAGSGGDEVRRMADYMIEEFQRWQAGLPLRYAVTLEMLETMA